MPDVWVFPGGRVDPSDAHSPVHSELSPAVAAKLESRWSPARARALAVAAVRETFEETGLAFGELVDGQLHPSLDRLDYLARAITPTMTATRSASTNTNLPVLPPRGPVSRWPPIAESPAISRIPSHRSPPTCLRLRTSPRTLQRRLTPSTESQRQPSLPDIYRCRDCHRSVRSVNWEERATVLGRRVIAVSLGHPTMSHHGSVERLKWRAMVERLLKGCRGAPDVAVLWGAVD